MFLELIHKVLELAKVCEKDYQRAVQKSCRRGMIIVLARDIDEIYINNYNPEWLLAWDGNIDIQPCFDFFGVITYITEYFTKDESGTSSFLAEASKQIKTLPILDQRKCIKNVFLTHRQMGVSEAFMKIFPEIKLKDSNIGTVFVPLGKKEDISRYLMRADPELNYFDKELFEIDDKEGLYYEKPNWIEKYLRRDMNQLGGLCLPQYVKMFDPTSKNVNKEDQDEEAADDQSEAIEENDAKTSSKLEKDKIKYGSEFKFHYIIKENGDTGVALPDLIKLENPYPGEPRFLRKRRHPKALRFFKVKRDINPMRYFLHELMMYKSFNKEDYDKWHDDERCQEDYEKHKDSIAKVKKKAMEWMEDVEELKRMNSIYI